MRSIFKQYLAIVLASVLLFSCEKAEELKTYPDGVDPVLTVVPTGNKASFLDSTVKILNLSWTDPKYAQEKSLYKFFLQIDTINGDFKNARIIKLDSLSDFSVSLAGYQFNSILYGYGYTDTTKKYDLYIRLFSSYGNNNEPKQSNAVKVQVAPYIIPKVPLPVNGELWIVGSATEGLDNPLNEPFLTTQKFKKINATKFEISIFLFGNRNYLLFPVMGSEERYCIDEGVDRQTLVNGGSFVFKQGGGQQFRSPRSSGNYKIIVDFMTATFSVTAE